MRYKLFSKYLPIKNIIKEIKVDLRARLEIESLLGTKDSLGVESSSNSFISLLIREKS